MWLLCGLAAALPLFAPPESVDALDAARLALWPDGDLQISGEPADWTGTALIWDGSQLVLVQDGHAFVSSTESDPELVVLLARTWTRDLPETPVETAPIPGEESFTPPVLPTSEAPPLTRGWTIGLGTQVRVDFPGGVEGVRVTAGIHRGILELESSLFLTSRSIGRVNGADRRAVAARGVTGFASPIETSRVGAWGCLRLPTPYAAGRVAGSRVCLGVRVHETSQRYLVGAVDAPALLLGAAPRLSAGPALAAGPDLWWGPWGARLAVRWGLRAFVRDAEPDGVITTRMDTLTTLTVDLVRRQRP